LVGASSNRSERHLEATLDRLGAQDQQISDVELKLSKSLDRNTQLTQQIHDLTKLIHQKAAVNSPPLLDRP
jgi:septal ring factor EnvC (AmiA/AmiB activator)